MNPAHKALIAHAQGAPMLAQTLRWAAINSGSRHLPGLALMAQELASACATLPGTPRLCAPQGDDQALGQNLHLVVRPQAPVQLLLTGHMDTVFGPDHPFQSCAPIDARGRVNGPGVADMKGGLAVMLAALAAFETWPGADRLGYEVVINADEEISSPGSAALIAAAARGKRAALTFEPAQTPEGLFTSARPGNANVALHVTGRSAHAGRNPQDGRNAVVAASDLALRLARARGAGLAINPARIEGGAPGNVVPDHAILHVNLRPATPRDEARARDLLADSIAQVARAHDVAIHMHGGFTRPPRPVTPAMEQLFAIVRDCGAALGLDLGWQPSGGVCDGNNIAACGVPVIDTMGVRGGAIHSDREFLIVDSLGERAALCALVLARLAAGA
jgi:glutamate carboxypeptidase